MRVPVAVKGTCAPTNSVGSCGDMVKVTSSAGVTITCAVAVLPLSVTVITAVPSPLVSTGKSAKRSPAGMVTIAGTAAIPAALLVTVTGVGAMGADDTKTRKTPGTPFGKV